MRLLTAIAALSVATGCATMQSYTVSSAGIPTKAGKWVDASHSTYTVLGLSSPEFETNLAALLQQKCPNGELIGMDTTLDLRNFLLVQVYSAESRAYCVPK